MPNISALCQTKQSSLNKRMMSRIVTFKQDSCDRIYFLNECFLILDLCQSRLNFIRDCIACSGVFVNKLISRNVTHFVCSLPLKAACSTRCGCVNLDNFNEVLNN